MPQQRQQSQYPIETLPGVYDVTGKTVRLDNVFLLGIEWLWMDSCDVFVEENLDLGKQKGAWVHSCRIWLNGHRLGGGKLHDNDIYP